jgi:hypothetical protein
MADNALSGMVDLLTKVMPMVTGSKSTQTESMQVDPGSNAALQALLAQLTGKAGGTEGADQILASLLDKAQLSTVLPAVGAQQQAGLYRGNPLADITARARAKAANDAMAVILQSQGQAGQSAAYLAANNQKANSKSVKTLATPGNPLAQLLSLGGAAYGTGQKLGLIGTGKDDPMAKLVTSIRGKQAEKTAEDIIAEGVTKGTMDATGAPLDLSTTDLGGFGANTSASGALGASEFAGAGAEGLGFDFGLDALGAGASMAEGMGAGALAAGGAELGTSLFAGAGAEALGFDFGMEALGASAGLGPIGFAIPIVASLIGDDSVICTEAHKQGLMPTALYKLETTTYLPTLSPDTVRGYQFLAAPAVRWMKRSKKAARFFAAGARAYAGHTTGYKHSILGAIIQSIGEPISTLVGHILSLSDSKTVKV